jgi:hypothetical protein
MNVKGLNMWQWLLLGVSVAFGSFLLIRNSRRGAKVQVPKDVPLTLEFHLSNLLIGYGYDKDVMLPYIIALSALESGRWTSGLWDYFNNPWGMKDPKERQTMSLGPTPKLGNVPEGFAVYSGAMTAAQDFCLYLNAKKCPKTFPTFYDFIAWIQGQGYEPGLSTMEYFQRCLNAVA